MINESDQEKILKGKELPWAEPSEIPVILCENRRNFWLIPPKKVHHAIPAAFVETYELKSNQTWDLILKFSNPSVLELARYSLDNPELPETIFFQVLDLKKTHKTTADWKEMGTLGKNARKLYTYYEFPLNILRLWERMESEYTDRWLNLFQKHNIKKNIIREIILYIYDLCFTDRDLCIQFAEKLSKNWENTRSPFPAEEVRNFIKQKRFPVSEKIQKNLAALKNKLGLKHPVHLHLPADLETESLNFTIQADSCEEILKAAEILQDSKRKDIFRKMFQEIKGKPV
ncbi:MAG: hypothetical protein OEZ34_15935 [Spirochaetia bacterium]|nr:hypothetical protein [Spirochaetia bacterium]